MNVWSKYPFLRIIIPLIVGIVVCHYLYCSLSKEIPVLFTVTFLVTVILLFTYLSIYPGKYLLFKGSWIYGIMLNLMFILIGILITSLTFPESQQNHFSHAYTHKNSYVARIISQPIEKNNKYRIELEIKQVISDGSFINVTGKVLAKFENDSAAEQLKYGDELLLISHLNEPAEPKNPEEFNYKLWLINQGISHVTYVRNTDFKVIGQSMGYKVLHIAISAREKFINQLKQNIGLEEFAVAAALLTGYDHFLDAEQRQEYAGAGVIHILSVSGMHAGIIYMFSVFFLSFLSNKKLSGLLKATIIIFILWSYAFFTGLAAPVIRASVMFSIFTIAKAVGRDTNNFNILGFAAFNMLFFKPLQLFDIGFQLSFSAVLGIFMFYPMLKSLWKPDNKIVLYLWNLTVVSLSAQIFTGPLVIYYFHQFPVFFLVANFIAIPLSGLAIYTGIAYAFFIFWPFINRVLGLLLESEISLLNGAISYIDRVPGAIADNLNLSLLSLVVLLFLISTLTLWIVSKNKRFLFFAATSTLLLASIAVRHHFIIRDQVFMVVHHKYKHTLVSLIKGQNAVVLTDSLICKNPLDADYTNKGLYVKSGIKTSVYHAIDTEDDMSTYSSPIFYTFHGKEIALLNRHSSLSQQEYCLTTQYVIIRNDCKCPLELIAANFPNAKIIADGSNRSKVADKLKNDGEKYGIKVFLTSYEGAFIEYF